MFGYFFKYLELYHLVVVSYTISFLLIFLSPGLVGLAISYALSVTDRLSGMVTSFTETEKQMVSVERAVQYIEDVIPEHSPRGSVSFKSVFPKRDNRSFRLAFNILSFGGSWR